MIDGLSASAGGGDPHRARDRDTAGIGQALQPRRDIDAVAIHRAVGLLDDVAQVNTDAKTHLALCWQLIGHRIDGGLDGQRGSHRTGGHFENGQHRVAGHVDDAALAGLHLGPQHRARRVERLHRGAFVDRHQARVSAASSARIADNRCLRSASPIRAHPSGRSGESVLR